MTMKMSSWIADFLQAKKNGPKGDFCSPKKFPGLSLLLAIYILRKMKPEIEQNSPGIPDVHI